MPWQPTSALLDYEPAERSAIAAVLAQDSSSNVPLKRERALSPREVFDAGKANLVKLPLAVGAILLGDIPGVERPVKNNQIEISVPEVDPDAPLVFGLTRRDGRGVQEPLRNDDKWEVRVNPLDPGRAWLYHADGSFAGVAPFYGRVRRDDPETLRDAYAAKRKALAPMIAESRRLAANITRDATERAAVNQAILGPTPNQQARQAASARDKDDARKTILDKF